MSYNCVNPRRFGGPKPSMFDHLRRLRRHKWIPPKGALARPTGNHYFNTRIVLGNSLRNFNNPPPFHWLTQEL